MINIINLERHLVEVKELFKYIKDNANNVGIKETLDKNSFKYKY